MIRLRVSIDPGIDAIVASAYEAMDGDPPIDGGVALHLSISCPIPKDWSQRDKNLAWANAIPPSDDCPIDHILDMVLRGISGVVINSTSQVCNLTISKSYSNAPSIGITVAKGIE
jgi:hypothetical protein